MLVIDYPEASPAPHCFLIWLPLKHTEREAQVTSQRTISCSEVPSWHQLINHLDRATTLTSGDGRGEDEGSNPKCCVVQVAGVTEQKCEGRRKEDKAVTVCPVQLQEVGQETEGSGRSWARAGGTGQCTGDERTSNRGESH
ncbi:hypothetical protein WMY93_019839 [Mugilogobius chulae]|uniref:Uncharacterized protein n=1 Tax=Mugilogobius chulae TaxID=88201 RepID=A0AAW0NMC9_9GOBI